MQHAGHGKVIITSGAAGEVEVTMHIEFSNTGIITFIVDPYALTATKKDIQEHNAAQTAHEAKFEQKADVTDLNAHVNNSDIHVNPTTMGNYDTAISGLIEHTEDADIHVSAEEKAAWSAAVETAAKAAEDAAQALNLALPVWKMDFSITLPGTRFLCLLIPLTESF